MALFPTQLPILIFIFLRVMQISQGNLTCACASYFGINWTCLTSSWLSANECTKSVFLWMRARQEIWDPKLLPGTPLASILPDKSELNCNFTFITFEEHHISATLNYSETENSPEKQNLLIRSSSVEECVNFADRNYTTNYEVTLGQQFFNYMTWTAKKTFSCFIDITITSVTKNDEVWKSHTWVAKSTADGVHFTTFRSLSSIKIWFQYQNGEIVISKADLMMLGEAERRNFLDSIAISMRGHGTGPDFSIMTVLLRDEAVMHSVELSCSPLPENDVYFGGTEMYSFRRSIQNYDDKRKPSPPGKLTVMGARVFKDSTFIFKLAWGIPSAWKSCPVHYEVKCAMFDSQFDKYSSNCLACISSADHSSCIQCWNDMMQTEPAAVFRELIPWQERSNKAFIFQTSLAGLSRWQRINYQVMRCGWHLPQRSAEAQKAQFNQRASYLRLLKRSVILPGSSPEPTQVAAEEVLWLVTLCRVRGIQNDKTASNWSDVLVNHSIFHSVPKFSIVFCAKETMLLAQIRYFESENMFIATSLKKWSNLAVRPAIDTTHLEHGTSFINENKLYKDEQPRWRVACFYMVLDTWFAFIERGQQYMLASYSGDPGYHSWGNILWNYTGLITEEKPVQLRCGLNHAVLVWSEVIHSDGDRTIQLKAVQVLEDGSVSSYWYLLSELDLCSCSSNKKLTTASFDFFTESLQEVGEPRIGLLCGNMLCISSLFKSGDQSYELSRFDWIENGIASPTWISIDANQRLYLLKNGSDFLYIASIRTGKLELTMEKFYSPLAKVNDIESYPGFKSHITNEYNLKATDGLKASWQSVVHDATSYPVPPSYCIFPAIEEKGMVVKMTSNSSIDIEIRKQWNHSIECQGLARPPVVYQVDYALLTKELKDACSQTCANFLQQQLSLQNYILLDPMNGTGRLGCGLECYNCNTTVNCNSTQMPATKKSLELISLRPNMTYLIQISIIPRLPETAKELWYSNKEPHTYHYLYKTHHVDSHSILSGSTGMTLPTLVAVILLLFAVLCLICVIGWFYKRRWYLYSSLGRIVLKDLEREEMIGQGHFGEVWRATLCQKNAMVVNKKTVVVKLLRESASEKEKKEFREEALLLSKLQSNYIIKPIGICLESRPIMLAMEHMNGGSLATYLKKKEVRQHLQLEELLHIVEDVLKACVYLENEGYIHRDIAARNCLISLANNDLLRPKQTKLADFGLAKDVKSVAIYSSSSAAEEDLPVAWTAPEGFNGNFSSQSDVFAFGVLMFEIFSWGAMPYGPCSADHLCPVQSMTHQEIEFSVCVRQKTLCDYQDPCTSCFSDAAKSLMQMCFHYKPSLRPRFRKLQNFFSSAGTEMLEVAVPDIVRKPSTTGDGGTPLSLRRASVTYQQEEGSNKFSAKMMTPAYSRCGAEENGQVECVTKM